MKRITLTVTNDLTYDQRMHRICNSLGKNGFKVRLVGRKLPESKKIKNFPDFDIKRLNCFFRKSFLFYAEYNIRLFLYLIFIKSDFLVAVDLDTILPVMLVSKLKGKKFIYDAHEFFTEVPELAGRKFTKGIWEKIGKFCIQDAALCLTVSESLSDVLAQKYQKGFETIRNVPLLKEQKTSMPEKHTIIYQGAINEGRCLEVLLDALQDLDCNLIIAGEGDLSKKIKKIISDYKLESKVTFLGFVEPGELWQLTQKATIGFNLLSGNSLSYYYSLGNKFFAYLHAGVPVISNDFPEYKKINEEFETGMLIKNSKEELKKAVMYLTQNREIYLKMRENCFSASKKYNWQNEEKKLISLFNAL